MSPLRKRNSQDKFVAYILCGQTSAVCSLGVDQSRLWSADETTTEIFFRQKTDCICSLSCGRQLLYWLWKGFDRALNT